MKKARFPALAAFAALILLCGCDRFMGKIAFDRGEIDDRFVGYMVVKRDYDTTDVFEAGRYDADGAYFWGYIERDPDDDSLAYHKRDYDYGEWRANGDEIVHHRLDVDDYISYELDFTDGDLFTINGGDTEYVIIPF